MKYLGAQTVTDENGYFDTSDYATPSKQSKVGLEISKDGYKTAYRTYIDYNNIEPQTFLVVLVPVAQSPGKPSDTTSRKL